MRIIAFCGPKHCGKDTAAKALLAQNIGGIVKVPEKKLFHKNAFAYGVKKICHDTFGWGIDEMDDPIFKETKLISWPFIEPRWAMMDIANWMREKYGGDVHVRAWDQRIDLSYHCEVIPDHRFPEELEMLKARGALIIYINRASAEIALAEAKEAGDLKALNQSEAHYDLLKRNADYIIDNNGAPHEMQNAVLQAVRAHFGYWGYWDSVQGEDNTNGI